MGRHQKLLEMQSGNLTQEQKIKKEMAEETIKTGRNQLKKPPIWLINDIAKKEYRRLVIELNDIDAIGNLDKNNLGGYCNAYAFYLKATQDLAKEELIISKILPNGSNTKAENPLIKIQKNYAEEMRKFASLCGLTIDSRLKVATVKISKEEQEIINEFGDI